MQPSSHTAEIQADIRRIKDPKKLGAILGTTLARIDEVCVADEYASSLSEMLRRLADQIEREGLVPNL